MESEETKREETTQDEAKQEEAKREGYAPRPKYQVWAARIGLAAFIVLLIAYYLAMFLGGRR